MDLDAVEVNNMPCAMNTLFAQVAYTIFSSIVFYLREHKFKTNFSELYFVTEHKNVVWQ